MPDRLTGAAPNSTRSRRERIRLSALRLLGRALPAATARALRSDARILVIRPDHLGDVLLTTPSLALLRAAFPRAYIAALVGPWSAEVARRGPRLNAVRAYEFPGFTRRKASWVGQPYVQLRDAESIRRQKFDLAIVARPDHWWGAMLAATAGIPHRVGFDVPECVPFLTETVDAPVSAHAAELSLLLAGRVCALAGLQPPSVDERPTFRLTAADRSLAADRLRELPIKDDGPLVVLHPGSGADLKLWPTNRWARVLDLAVDRLGARTLIVSSSRELPLVQVIQRQATAAHPALTTDEGIGFLGAILERADAVVGCDSGPLHLATAVGAPTVRIYGPTDTSIFGPWPLRDDQVALRPVVPCSPCHHVGHPPCGAERDPVCMLEQTPESVMQALEWVLANRAR